LGNESAPALCNLGMYFGWERIGVLLVVRNSGKVFLQRGYHGIKTVKAVLKALVKAGGLTE